MNSDQPHQPASQPEPAKCSTCGKIDNQFCSNSFHLEQPAKDEWRAEVSGEGWSIYDQFNMWVCNCANEAIAKQIVEAVQAVTFLKRLCAANEMDAPQSLYEIQGTIHVLFGNHRDVQKYLKCNKEIGETNTKLRTDLDWYKMALSNREVSLKKYGEDWAKAKTETDELRAKLEQARAKIGEQEEALSELQDTFRKMTDNSFKQGELIGQLRAKVEGLEKYAAHKPDCQYYQTYIGGTGIKFHKECTCGLSALLEDKSDRTG